MNISPYFRNLRSAYFAELDDLTFDSEGLHILDKRLVQRRKEMEFLVHMMEISPEMVAVVFHGGFHFELPAVMEQVLTLESDEFPDWSSLGDAVQLTPWAQELADNLLPEPQGDWFMVVAAALEYLYHRPSPHQHEGAAHEDQAHEAGEAHGAVRRQDHADDFDKDGEQHHDHEESSAEWLEDQGFDRKE